MIKLSLIGKPGEGHDQVLAMVREIRSPKDWTVNPSGVREVAGAILSFGERRQRPGGRRARARREAGGRHCEEWC